MTEKKKKFSCKIDRILSDRLKRQQKFDQERRQHEKLNAMCAESWKQESKLDTDFKEARRKEFMRKPSIPLHEIKASEEHLAVLQKVPLCRLFVDADFKAADSALYGRVASILEVNKVAPEETFGSVLARLLLDTCCEKHLTYEPYKGHAAVIDIVCAATIVLSPHAVAQDCFMRGLRATTSCKQWHSLARLFLALGEMAFSFTGLITIADSKGPKCKFPVRNAYTTTIADLYMCLKNKDDRLTWNRAQFDTNQSLAAYGIFPGLPGGITLKIESPEAITKRKASILSAPVARISNLFRYKCVYEASARMARCSTGRGSYQCSGQCWELCITCHRTSAEKSREYALTAFCASTT